MFTVKSQLNQYAWICNIHARAVEEGEEGEEEEEGEETDSLTQ
jgi:hypothetical protein